MLQTGKGTPRRKLIVLPQRNDQLPDQGYLEWHNQNVYMG